MPLSHPACSPDLTPTNYHILTPLRDALHEHQFVNGEEEKDMIHSWCYTQPKTFFAHGIRKHVD
jgi:hypothetical protein